MLLTRASGGGHGAPRISRARIEVEVVFCLCNGGGRGAGGVHEGLDDFGEGNVLVCREKVFNTAKQVLKVRSQSARADKAIREPAAEGGEAAKNVVAAGGLGGGGGGGGHHSHAGDLADAFDVG